jgi:PBS lyase HEAT-like repeat
VIGVLAVIGAVLVVVELLALVGRRIWTHWKLGRRRALVDEALAALADAVATGVAPPRPVGRVRRHTCRLAALELFPQLAGASRARLTALIEDLGLVEDAMRTLARSPRSFARRVAADELGEIRSPRAAPSLAAGLDDRDRIVRVACARGLALINDLTRIDQILHVLERDSASAASEASVAMYAVASVSPEALATLQKPEQPTYSAWLASLTLARVGHASAMPSLIADLAADNVVLGSIALRAIEEFGGQQAIDSLERFAADADRDASLRAQAARALGRLRAPGGAR